LDEATSYLDPTIEAQVMEAIARLMRGRTVLILAHRLSTVYDADWIVVVDGGRVVEVGTHHELQRRQGLYCHLVHAQDGVTL
jgi:ABC-type multidrug transport system fused ATPase/permease subunit